MMQPLFLAGNTASDLKAHKESEVTENGLLSSEQGSSLNKLRFSELLNDKIVADKTATDNAAKLQDIPTENLGEVANTLTDSATSLTEQNQEIDQNQQQLMVSDSPTNKVIGQNLVNQQESTVEVLPTTTNDNAELTSTYTQVVDRQATEQLSEQSENGLEQQQVDVSFSSSKSTNALEQQVNVSSSSLNSVNEPIEQMESADLNSIEMLDELIEPKQELPEPESVVNTQLVAGNSDNIQTVDQGAAFTFDNFNAQPTKLDANSVQNDTDSEIVLSDAKGQTTVSQQAQLLSSIRDAQQINTNVQSNSTSSLANMQQTNLNTTQGENQVVVDELVQGKQGTLEKNQLDSPINLTNKTTELVGTEQTSSLAEVPSAEGEQSDSEHIPATLKVEGLAAAQTITDVNGAKPIQTNAIQSDKLVAVNQQMQATNHLLQEPLDIQSKQAAHLMGERVMMMLSEGKQEVQIRLDPAELGSMFIKVQVQQDQVQLNIQTQAGLSKDIIEQNMPRLREQLAQQGIQLSEANVEQQSQQSQQRQQSGQQASSTVFNGNTADNRDMVEDNGTAIWVPSKIASNDQGIDYYA